MSALMTFCSITDDNLVHMVKARKSLC